MRRRWRAFVATLRRVPFRAVAFDGLFVVGLGSTAVGIGEIFRPAALIFLGVALMGLWLWVHLR